MADNSNEKDGEQNKPIEVAPKKAEYNGPESAELSETESSSPSELDGRENKQDPKKQPTKIRPAAIRTQTATSEVSTGSRATNEPQTKTKLSLSKRLNPFKRNPPPIPEERIVSKEYGANFFSMLSFHWISPIMAVRLTPLGAEMMPTNLDARSAMPGHSKSTTCTL